jgi:signal transduction histidine kinase
MLIGIVPLFVFFNVAVDRLEEYHYSERHDEIEILRSRVAFRVGQQGFLFDEGRRDEFDEEIMQLSNEIADTRVRVIDDSGQVVSDSRRVDVGRFVMLPIVVAALEEGVSETMRVHGNMEIVSASPILDDEGAIAGAVYVTSSIAYVREITEDFRNTIFGLAAAISVIVLILVWFAAWLLINPLRKIVKTIQVISDGNLSERISVGGRDEFGELRDAFNKMTSQLEKIDANRQEFVSNVSHELRTPLSSIKVLSDSLLNNESAGMESYREFMEDISSEVDRMNNIVNELLTLVHLEQGEPVLNVAAFRVNKTVVDILKRLYPIAEGKDIELLVEDVKQVNMDGDEIKLSLAISNLIENGIKYTPNGGTVKVVIDADHQHVFITIQDTGIGINELDQSKVFTRFYRADKTRSRETGGTGLGLSIAHKTVLLHHGIIRITSKENEGTSFMVRLPLKQD